MRRVLVESLTQLNLHSQSFLKLHRSWLIDTFGPLAHDPTDETEDVFLSFAIKQAGVDGYSSGAAILGKQVVGLSAFRGFA